MLLLPWPFEINIIMTLLTLKGHVEGTHSVVQKGRYEVLTFVRAVFTSQAMIK